MNKKNKYWFDVRYKKIDGGNKFLEIELSKKQWESLKTQLATTPKIDETTTEYTGLKFTSKREYYVGEGCGFELVHHIHKD